MRPVDVSSLGTYAVLLSIVLSKIETTGMIYHIVIISTVIEVKS